MAESERASEGDSERRRHGSKAMCTKGAVCVVSGGVQRRDSRDAGLVGELLQRWGAFEAQAWRSDLQAAEARTAMMRGGALAASQP
jgi:hypothetical protein